MIQLARRLLLCSSGYSLPELRRVSHETARERCLVGAFATLAAASAATPLSLPRPQASGLSPDPHRYPLRSQDGHRLGRPACRIGLRLRQDLSPLPPPLASSWRLADAACR